MDTTTGLRVQPDQTLALVGGDLSLEGATLKTAGGRIELGSVLGNSLVSLTPINKGFSLGYGGVQNEGNIQLSQRAAVDASGEGGGDIQVWGRNVILTNGSQMEASTLGSKPGGSLAINAQDSVQLIGLSADADQFHSGLFAQAYPGTTGAAGDLTIKTGDLLIRDGGLVRSSTFGKGDAGNIFITARNGISLDAADIVSNVQSNNAQGNAGNIDITTGSLAATRGAQINSFTRGTGNAGNVTITATGAVTFDGVDSNRHYSGTSSSVEAGGVGNGGNINITAGSLSLTNGAELDTTSAGQGNAGNIIVDARDRISLDNNSFAESRVGQGSKGKAGDIHINTGSLSLTNGAVLDTSSSGQGDAGNILVQAQDTISVAGRSLILSNIGSPQGQQALGNVGNIQLEARTVSLTDTAQLQAGFYSGGQGNPGLISVKARDSISFAGTNSGIFSNVDPGGVGNGSDIQISAPSVSFTDGAVLEASNAGRGNGGNISISAESLSFDGSNVFSRVQVTGQGKGGDIRITSKEISVSNSATLNVNSFAQGYDAGDISLSTGSLRLDRGFIAAGTLSGNGGNIALQVGNYLLLRHSSQISTSAGGTASAGGNGGNITINAPSGFIVALPNEKSNITANAFNGSGGTIQINATGIFGLTVLSREDLVRLFGTNDLTQLDFQRLPTSAITAISQTNPTLSGNVVVDTANINPSQGLVPVSTNLINTNTLIANSCIARTKKQQGTFYITGAGGLPTRPGDASVSSYPTGTIRNLQGNGTSTSWQKGDPIVEPQGVYQLPNGHLVLSRECS